MNPNETQREKVEDMLDEFGYVKNSWAIKNSIWRLGAIMRKIRKDEGLYSYSTFYQNKKGLRDTVYVVANREKEIKRKLGLSHRFFPR